MAFDPITFSQVLNSKNPIGSAIRVVSSFSDPKYLASNQVFDASVYPELGAQIAGGFKGDIWERSTSPSVPSDISATIRVAGQAVMAWSSSQYNYVLTRITTSPFTSYLYRTSSTSRSGNLTLVKTIPAPSGITAMQYSVAGNRLFQSFEGKSFNVYDLEADPEMSAPESRSLPASAQTTPYIFAEGNGVLVAVTTASSSTGYGLNAAGSGFRSTDGGFSWGTGVLISSTITSPVTGLTYGNGVFVITTTSTTANYAYSSNGGTSWTTGVTSPATSRGAVVFDTTRNVFMAMPAIAAGVICESANGSTWAAKGTCPVAVFNWLSARFASDGTLVCGLGATVAVASSTDRTNFTSYTHATDASTGGSVSTALMGDSVVKFSAPTSNANAQYQIQYSLASNISSWGSINNLGRSNIINYLPFSFSNTALLMDATPPANTQYASNSWNGIVSGDRGKTWTQTQISSGGDLVYWNSIVVTPNGFMAVGKIGTGTGFLVFATSSDGVTWAYTNTNGSPAAISGINSVACSANGVILVTTNASSSNILRSTNNGSSWGVVNSSTGIGAAFIVYSIGTGFAGITYTTGTPTTSACKYSVDGTSWISSSSLPTLTASYPTTGANGVQGINTIGIVLMGRSSTGARDVMYTLNGGANWVMATLPAQASQSSPVGVIVVNGVVIIPLANGYILRTSDITNPLVWELTNVTSPQGAITGHNFAQISGNDSSNSVVMFSSSSIEGNLVVRGIMETSNYRRVPYMPADVPGTTWVLRAR